MLFGTQQLNFPFHTRQKQRSAFKGGFHSAHLDLGWIPINEVALKLFFPAVSVVTENTMLELETWFKYMHIENSVNDLRAEWSVSVCVKHNTWYSTLRISLFRNISLYSYRNHSHCERESLDGRQRKIRLCRAMRAKSIMLIKCMLDKEERGMCMYVCMNSRRNN